jgi:HEPN domain-containing protein
MSVPSSQREAEALRWLSYAEEDLGAAEVSADDTALAPRHRCMLAQQAAEKATKAALILLDIDPPRTHNIQLLADMLPEEWALRATPADLARLSLWIVESRYPGDWPDATQGDTAVAVADARAVVDAAASDIARVRGAR